MKKENLDLFFDDFATNAEIVSGPRTGQLVRGIFDLSVEDAIVGNFAYASRGGIFLAKYKEVKDLEGAFLEIEEMPFEVALVTKDGTGMAKLHLQERRTDA